MGEGGGSKTLSSSRFDLTYRKFKGIHTHTKYFRASKYSKVAGYKINNQKSFVKTGRGQFENKIERNIFIIATETIKYLRPKCKEQLYINKHTKDLNT